ncbi:MAG: HIT family protein [Candidatus Lokiarchaeia archaeon]
MNLGYIQSPSDGLLNLKKVILECKTIWLSMFECLFCKMFKGELESKKVYEDDNNIAVLDINPRMHECQVLVIPKTHVKQFYELSDEENASLFKAVKEVASMINKAYNPEFVSLFSRGMGIPHAHIIVSPAWRNDVILTGFMLNRMNIFFNAGVSPQKLDMIAEKLTNAK